MTPFRISSIEHPLDDPEVFALLARVLARVEAMGLVDRIERFARLGEENLRAVLEGIRTSGIATRPLSELRFGEVTGARDWAELLRTVDRVLEESPVPDHEWGSLIELLGPEALTDLLGVSFSSIRRYASGARETPDEVAERLHFLALLVADLAGGYNEMGIRRWFERPRSALDGRSPKQLLGRGWLPEQEGPRRIRELARSLTGSPAT